MHVMMEIVTHKCILEFYINRRTHFVIDGRCLRQHRCKRNRIRERQFELRRRKIEASLFAKLGKSSLFWHRPLVAPKYCPSCTAVYPHSLERFEIVIRVRHAKFNFGVRTEQRNQGLAHIADRSDKVIGETMSWRPMHDFAHLGGQSSVADA